VDWIYDLRLNSEGSREKLFSLGKESSVKVDDGRIPIH